MVRLVHVRCTTRWCVSMVYMHGVYFICFLFFFKLYGDHRDLHVLTPSFPTRRSSDLKAEAVAVGAEAARWRREIGGGPRIRRPRRRRFPASIGRLRSEEHTSELQSLMRISYAVFCLKKQK